MRRLAPLPVAALGAGLVALAFATDHPAVVGAVLVSVLGLQLAAPRRAGAVYLLAGSASALGLVLLTPLVRSDGGRVLLQGPEMVVIDTEITTVELLAGAVAGARVLAVVVLVGVLLANVDADRLQSRVAAVAPRSAMAVSLAVRLLPALERDARSLGESARARGLRLTEGGWAPRARNATRLAPPLMGSGIERSVDIAEAMVARGYSGARIAALPAVPLDGRERLITMAGAVLTALAVAALAGWASPAALGACAVMTSGVTIGALRR